MQLLHSRAAPGPEFASLSVTFRRDIASNDTISTHILEPFLIPSPLSTISHDDSIESLRELHHYLNAVTKAVKSKKGGTDGSRMAAALLREDAKCHSDELEVFRPHKGNGIGLHYRIIREPKLISILAPLIFSSSKATAPPSKSVESDISSIIICIGMSGLPSAVGMSPLYYSLSQRIRDCLQILARTGSRDIVAAKTLMTTLLLTEDDDRTTNSMADGLRSTLLDDDTKMWTRTRKMNTKGKKGKSSKAIQDDDFDTIRNSADKARTMVERLQVLSVVETDTIFKKFEGKTNHEKSSKKRRQAAADLDGFDFQPDKMGSSQSTRRSSNGAGPQSNSSRDGRRLPAARQNRNVGGPAPGRDNRKARNDSSIDTRRSQNSRGDMSGFSSAFDNAGGSVFSENDSIPSRSPAPAQQLAYGNQGRRKFDPFNGNANSVGEGTSSTASETTMGSMFPQNMPPGTNGGHRRNLNGQDLPRFQVNVALSEDLTCFYKLSKMSSCTVEGGIQVQIQSNAEVPGLPFFLLIRDRLHHIESIQENKKFATMVNATEEDDADHVFIVTVPKADNYFPVIRYKCNSELRPVPIRVQTRVRLEERFWRVALQISSNPHNEDNLTDLTIIMGVPPMVQGETLTTSPPGGVWNASKRSVIWCVSELGGGEKFQLQARFAVDPDTPVSEDDKPKFPVLVRCQCKYAQLSEVELEAIENPDVFPADLRMKLARRFRLSHRERP
ncbi:MAG: hypothetical protein SGBAC_000019 [Bacillariaceae sp.]